MEAGVGEGREQRLIFVGGKGGVGKTTTSSALAVRLADSGLETLIVSTDPAHSLGDALMQDISGGKPVDVTGCDNLMAMEVDTADAVQRFRDAVGGFRASDLGLGGVAEEVVSKLGLDEFADILGDRPIEIREPYPEELDEPALLELPRIELSFDTRSYGKLRQLVDRLITL